MAGNKRFSFADFLKIKAHLLSAREMTAVIVSGSMHPIIKMNDQLKVAPTTVKDLKPFDILVFLQNEILIAHYFVCISRLSGTEQEAIVITRSIQGRHEDFPVKESNILGVVTSHQIPWHHRLRQLWLLWTSR